MGHGLPNWRGVIGPAPDVSFAFRPVVSPVDPVPLQSYHSAMEHNIHRRARVAKNASLEAPVNLAPNPHVERNAKVGRFSYLSAGAVLSKDCSLGRYCSVARGVQIGVLGHPTDWLSTHPFQYSSYHFSNNESYLEAPRLDYDRKAGDPNRA